MNKINSDLKSKICFLKRSADNIFKITSEPHINDILEYVHSLCQSIQCTIEIEENNRLSHLNILIEHKKFIDYLEFVTIV